MGKRTTDSVKPSPKKPKRSLGIELNDLTDARSKGSCVSEGLLDNKAHVWVRPFCSKASVYDDRFADDRLDFVQLACKTTAESPLYQLKHRVDQFCKHMRDNGHEDVVADFDDFQVSFGFCFPLLESSLLTPTRSG